MHITSSHQKQSSREEKKTLVVIDWFNCKINLVIFELDEAEITSFPSTSIIIT